MDGLRENYKADAFELGQDNEEVFGFEIREQ